MKKLFSALAMTMVLAANGWCALTIEVLDFATGKVRMTYEVDDKMTGNKEFRFPGGGFIHDESEGDFVVESVFDEKNNYELSYSVQKIGDEKQPQLKITYPEALKAGEVKAIRIEVVLHLPNTLLYTDSGRYFIEYETSHDFEYRVPENHYIVFSNLPVQIYEKGGELFVKQTHDKIRKIKLATRKMDSVLFGGN